jgi:hypothetical protein
MHIDDISVTQSVPKKSESLTYRKPVVPKRSPGSLLRYSSVPLETLADVPRQLPLAPKYTLKPIICTDNLNETQSSFETQTITQRVKRKRNFFCLNHQRELDVLRSTSKSREKDILAKCKDLLSDEG